MHGTVADEVEKVYRGSKYLFVFRGFNGRLGAKNPASTSSGPARIGYDQFLGFLEPLVNRIDGDIGGGAVQKTFCHLVRVGRVRFRGGESGRPIGAPWIAWGPEVHGFKEAVQGYPPKAYVTCVAGGHESTEDPGARYADRVRVRDSSAEDGGGRPSSRRGRGPL